MPLNIIHVRRGAPDSVDCVYYVRVLSNPPYLHPVGGWAGACICIFACGCGCGASVCAHRHYVKLCKSAFAECTNTPSQTCAHMRYVHMHGVRTMLAGHHPRPLPPKTTLPPRSHSEHPPIHRQQHCIGSECVFCVLPTDGPTLAHGVGG